MGATTDLAETIRAAIADGTYAVGDRVPTIRQLAEEHGVAYATASKAVEMLRNEGLVESRPGRGTVVRSGGATSLAPVQAQLDELRSRVEALEAAAGSGKRESHGTKRTVKRSR